MAKNEKIRLLRERWQCNLTTCHSKHCYVPADGPHFPLSHDLFNKWAAAMVCYGIIFLLLQLITECSLAPCRQWWTICYAWTPSEYPWIRSSLSPYHCFKITASAGLCQCYVKRTWTTGASCQCCSAKQHWWIPNLSTHRWTWRKPSRCGLRCRLIDSVSIHLFCLSACWSAFHRIFMLFTHIFAFSHIIWTLSFLIAHDLDLEFTSN